MPTPPNASESLGVKLRLHTGVKEIRADRVVLDDDSEILTRCVVWAGGIKPPGLTAHTGLAAGTAVASMPNRI
jgi:NADH dehydrogenase